jgi:HPt (histidine-containing phosphotransfer) domain-containing protein
MPAERAYGIVECLVGTPLQHHFLIYSMELTNVHPNIDRSRLNQLQELGGDILLARVIQQYLSEGEKLIGKIGEAILEKDYGGLHRSAHTLKGSSLNVGVESVAEVARTLENCGREGTIATASAMFGELKEIFAGARRSLESIQSPSAASTPSAT